MRRATQLTLTLACAAGVFAGATFAQIAEAEACGGPTPSDCGISANCAIVVNSNVATNLEETITSAITSSVFLGVLTNSNECNNLADNTQTRMTIHKSCRDMTTPGAQFEYQDSQEWTFNTEAGLNRFIQSLDFEPGPERECLLEGDLAVDFSTPNWFGGFFGVNTLTLETECAPQNKCLSSSNPEEPGSPYISVEMQNDDGIISGRAGQPEVFSYEIRNNSTQSFSGTMSLDSANADAPTSIEGPELEPVPEYDIDLQCDSTDLDPPEEDDLQDCEDADNNVHCGCDQRTYANHCLRENAGAEHFHDGPCVDGPSPQTFSSSMEGDGDNFPVAFVSELPNDDLCIPMPENPATYTQPTIQQPLELGPGETKVVDVVQRSWGECADGSCSNTTLHVSGNVGDQPVIACGGGALVINESGMGPNETPPPSPDPIQVCPDEGDTAPPGEYNPDEPDFAPPEDTRSGETVTIPDEDGGDDEEVFILDEVIDIYDLDLNDPDLLDPDTEPYIRDYTWDSLTETDSNDNGIPDAVEIAYGYDPLDPATPENPDDYTTEELLARDTSGNGVSDYEEIFIYGSDINDADTPVFFNPYITIDTNGNGVPDYIEVAFGYDPLDSDTPLNPDDYAWDVLLEQDSSGNGIPDAVEIAFRYDPLDPDTPADPSNYTEDVLQVRDSSGNGLTDYEEIWDHQTDPLAYDTDGDGFSDGQEVENGTDPLDPTDPGDEHYSNTPIAGVIFNADDEDLTTLVRLLGSDTSGLHVESTRATSVTLNQQIGRIYETLAVDPDSFDIGDTVQFQIPFDASPYLESSPYQINRMDFGEKFLDSSDDGTYLGAKGQIRLDSEPFTIFNTLYRLQIRAVEPHTGQEVLLQLSDVDFHIDGSDMVVTIDVETPDFGFHKFMVTHDFNANKKAAYVENCDDDVDNTGNGLAGCDDPYCADDPVCTGDPGDDDGDEDDDGNDDDDGTGDPDDDDRDGGGGVGDTGQDGTTHSGGGCSATDSSGQPMALVLMALVGLVAIRRRNRDRDDLHRAA